MSKVQTTQAKICLTSQGQLLILSDSGVNITIDNISLSQVVICDTEQKDALFLSSNEASVLVKTMKYCLTQKLSDEARATLEKLIPVAELMVHEDK